MTVLQDGCKRIQYTSQHGGVDPSTHRGPHILHLQFDFCPSEFAFPRLLLLVLTHQLLDCLLLITGALRFLIQPSVVPPCQGQARPVLTHFQRQYSCGEAGTMDCHGYMTCLSRWILLTVQAGFDALVAQREEVTPTFDEDYIFHIVHT